MTFEEKLCEILERIAAAEEARNQYLAEERVERREAWERSEASQATALARLVDPVTWLEDGEHDRLYWAIARARGHVGGSDAEDEAEARAIIAELRRML